MRLCNDALNARFRKTWEGDRQDTVSLLNRFARNMNGKETRSCDYTYFVNPLVHVGEKVRISKRFLRALKNGTPWQSVVN
jgi:hypothetical protein